MQIRKILSLVGPNIWANYPVLEAWVDLGAFDTQPSNTLPGFPERLMAWLPSMIEHRCSEGVRGGFFSRLRDGTWLGHVLEHVTLELETLAHLPVGYGRTRETSERGVYRVVVEALDAKFAEACLLAGRELILAAIEDRSFDVAARLRALRDLADKQCLGPSTQAIVTAAKKRAIPHVRISEGNLVQLGYGRAQRRIWAAETAKTCALAESIAQDKELTRKLLCSVGVPMPAGRTANSREDAWEAAIELGLPVVVKPQDANHGRGVSIRLEHRAAVEAAFDIAAREGTGVVVERFVSGTQYRVLVVGDKAVAASGGEAEQVLADGVHTVEELVEEANRDPQRGEGSALPLTTLVLDEISVQLLRQQGLDKTSVPQAGRAVLIHYNGDLTVDVTDRMHPDVASSCVVAAQTVGLDVAGIDVIAEDIGKPLEAQGGAIIEVNASPGLVMHLQPLVGPPRPVGEAIVEHLFPVAESGRVPLVAVSGTNGKTFVTAMVAAMLVPSSHGVGQAGSHGLLVGKRLLSHKDARQATAMRRLLLNPFVDAMVVETSEVDVLREGLAFDRCDVAVVVNLGSADHMGEQYLGDRSFFAKAVRAPLDVVLPDGCAVLNADDPDVAVMAEKCRARVVFFSRDPGNPVLAGHVAKGGIGVALEGGQLVSVGEERPAPILNREELEALAVEPFGLPDMVLEDVLAAAGAGVGLGLPTNAIRRGILEGMPHVGFVVRNVQGRTVVVSQARNPSSLAAWTRLVAQSFSNTKRHAIVQVPADWRAEDASESASLLRTLASTVIVVPSPAGDAIARNLYEKLDRPGVAEEKTMADALARIFRDSGPSDFIFVGPALRAGCDQANTFLDHHLDPHGAAAVERHT